VNLPDRSCIVSLVVALALVSVADPVRANGLHPVSHSELGANFTCIGISHRDPNFVMVGTAEGKILRTTDGGATWQTMVVTPSRTLFYGRERSPDPRMEYALGLPGKSPHLQRWLRQKGLTTSGVNWQQLLVQKGDKMVSVNWIEVDWHDESRIYVGTVDGLYRSLDGGRTFIRIYQGITSMAERMVNTVATDPSDPNKLLLGTASGLFLSNNRGASFRKTMNYYMRDSYIREIWFDPEQPGLVHVAMGGSAMASPDGGAHWITTHWDEWGPRADVQSISLGPDNVRLIGTRDGVFASFQGGEMGSWKRTGFRFVGHTILKVLATRDPRAWYALTSQALWVTLDAGLNWFKVHQLGGHEAPKWIASPRGTDQLWLITNRQIYRLGQPARAARINKRKRTERTLLLDIPPLVELRLATLRRHELYFGDNQKYRQRGPWAALLPSITAGFHYAPGIDVMRFHDYMHPHWPYRYFNRAFDMGVSFEVFANWNLGRLIFDKRELPHWGRIQRNLGAIRQDITERVHQLYMEYKRVARTLVYNPPADELTRQFLTIRLQEITAYLDSVSGGYWSKKTKGVPQ
jgi:photosystem II stability/assembly factor-like uncharacterized protein